MKSDPIIKLLLKIAAGVLFLSFTLIPYETLAIQGQGADSSWEANDTATGINHLLDIVLVIDNSGSMLKNDPDFITKDVVANFVKGLDKNSRLSILLFDETARLIEPLTFLKNVKSKTKFIRSLNKINYRGKFTDSPAAIERALYELKLNAREDAYKTIIFLTDGIIDTGNKAEDRERTKWLRESLAQKSKDDGIRIFGIAFTEKADFQLIQTLAVKTDGEYFRVPDAADFHKVFKKIEQAINTKTKQEIIEAVPTPQDVSTDPPEASDDTETIPVDLAPPDLHDDTTEIPAEHTTPDLHDDTTKKPTQDIHDDTSKIPAKDAVTAVEDHASEIPADKKKYSIIFAGIAAGIIIILFFTLLIKKYMKKKAMEKPVSDGIETQAALLDVENSIAENSLTLPLIKKIIKIGRDSENDIVIPQNTISNFHAKIESRHGFFYLEDLRSSNGTQLNGEPLRSNNPVLLKTGDGIKFSTYEFRFLQYNLAPSGETVMIKTQ